MKQLRELWGTLNEITEFIEDSLDELEKCNPDLNSSYRDLLTYLNDISHEKRPMFLYAQQRIDDFPSTVTYSELFKHVTMDIARRAYLMGYGEGINNGSNVYTRAYEVENDR